jgi:flagellar biosynthesis/type III secretory pathway protein FliH
MISFFLPTLPNGSKIARSSSMWKARINLSPEIRPGTKKKILEQEYGIPMTVEMEKETENMCDYGRGLARKYAAKGLAEGLEKGIAEGLEKGMQKGRAEGRNEGIQQERNSNILGMLREKIPMETIARITKVSVEQIRELGKLNGVL